MMLVNKFYHLKEDYVPENIVDASKTYAYDENSATEETISAFKKMYAKAKSEGLNLIITSSYRTYKDQDRIWNSYAIRESEEWADAYAARPGYSEHQTGLALDIVTYKSTMDNFDETPEAKWLADNAYKYGFILRYPKDKENLTGYDYEPWHYRYVGVENAKKIYKEGITFEEYYAYYVENKD
ncbi:MAG: M15 family metallopeptidase [Bacilli bacterium]|nr:M15 family metallopeptidase [Bacilli bacterium]